MLIDTIKNAANHIPIVMPEILHGTKIDKHRLDDHRCSAEYFHVDVQNQFYDKQQGSFDDGILFGHRNGLHDADRKTDQTSDKGTHQCDQ